MNGKESILVENDNCAALSAGVKYRGKSVMRMNQWLTNGMKGAKRMELILMRHGKAEDGQPHLPDRERRLTPQGRERIEAAARAFRSRLVEKERVHIWSSDLRRAKETAEIIAAPYGSEVRVMAEIGHGELDAVVESWADLSAKDTLIIVGHEPDMGLWSARIANVVLPFRPGSAAAFRLEERVPPFGRLLWFMHSGMWAKLTDD